jgi:hypothetical protein
MITETSTITPPHECSNKQSRHRIPKHTQSLKETITTPHKCSKKQSRPRIHPVIFLIILWISFYCAHSIIAEYDFMLVWDNTPPHCKHRWHIKLRRLHCSSILKKKIRGGEGVREIRLAIMAGGIFLKLFGPFVHKIKAGKKTVFLKSCSRSNVSFYISCKVATGKKFCRTFCPTRTSRFYYTHRFYYTNRPLLRWPETQVPNLGRRGKCLHSPSSIYAHFLVPVSFPHSPILSCGVDLIWLTCIYFCTHILHTPVFVLCISPVGPNFCWTPPNFSC